jgi:hypothetical protein
MTQEQIERRAENCRKIAAKGGKAVAERRGAEYMSEIGKRGFQKTLTTHGFSDGGALASWLMGNGRMVKGFRPSAPRENLPAPVLTGRITIAGGN